MQPLMIDSFESIFCNGDTFVLQQSLDDEVLYGPIITQRTPLFKNKADVMYIETAKSGMPTLYTKVVLVEGGRTAVKKARDIYELDTKYQKM